MSTLAQIVDKKACGGEAGANTGKLGCLSLFGEPSHLVAMKKGTVIPKETDLDLTYLSLQVQKGIFIPLIDATAFEDLSSENAMSTTTKGVERLNVKGLPKYKLTFEEGHEFYREISKLTSFKTWDFGILDEEGNWILAKDSAGDYGGMSAGQVVAEMRKAKVAGGDAESKAITAQFLERLQWDENYGIVHNENLTTPFTPQEIPLVNGVNLEFLVVPADTDVILEVGAKLSQDNDTPVEGLILADFLVTVDGVTVVPTLVDEPSPGEYDITIAALATGEVVFIDLWDGTLNVNVVDSLGVLYRSPGVTETVVV